MATCNDCIHLEVCKMYCESAGVDFEKFKFKPTTVCDKFKPTADVVEVVRCKDCKHWIYWADCKYCTCDIHHHKNMTINDFCSYGERKDT